METKNIESSFDEWLTQEGIYEQVTSNALKRVQSRQRDAAERPDDEPEA